MCNISGSFSYVCSNFLRVWCSEVLFMCEIHLHENVHSLIYEIPWVPLDQ